MRMIKTIMIGAPLPVTQQLLAAHILHSEDPSETCVITAPG